MNNKVYVGKRVSKYTGYGNTRQIDGIALTVDEENTYTAGNTEGYVLELTCPFGSQVMANNIMAELQGKSYTAYGAENAVADPEAELGDGVTVNGTYNLLATKQMVMGSGHIEQIGAPADSEIDHEFGVSDPYTHELERKFSGTRSYIEKKSNEITSRVEQMENDVTQKYSEFQQTLDGFKATVDAYGKQVSEFEQTVEGFKATVEQNNGLISEFEQTVEGFNTTVEGYAGQVSQFQQSVNGFKSTVEGYAGQVSEFKQALGNISLSVTGSMGQNASITLTDGEGQKHTGTLDLKKGVRQAFAADDSSAVTISAGTITFNGNTFISNCNNFKVDAQGILNSSKGFFHYAQADIMVMEQCLFFSANYYSPGGGMKPPMTTDWQDQGLNIDANLAAEFHGDIYILEGSLIKTLSGKKSIIDVKLNYSGLAFGNSNMATYIVGYQIFHNNVVYSTSDRDKKTDISLMDESFLPILDNMKPVIYRRKESAPDSPFRYGYIAQEVEEAIQLAGKERSEAGFVIGEDGTGEMAIAYEEIIPLLHLKIKQLERRIEKLETA